MKKLSKTFDDYRALNKGVVLKKAKTSPLQVGKSLLAVSLPLLTLTNLAKGQCVLSSNFVNNVIVPEGIDGPDAGKAPDGNSFLDVDIDGGGVDLRFYERRAWSTNISQATGPGLGPLKVRAVGGMQLMRTSYTSYPNTNASVRNFANGDNIPGAFPLFTYGYIDANGGFGQWQANEAPTGPGGTVTGNMGIFKTNYGFVELTVVHDLMNSQYRISITAGGFADTGGSNIVVAGDCSSLGTLLPVDLLTFETEVKAEQITLNWETASETNNAGFEVERITDGQSFRPIGFIEGQGTSTEQQKYFFDDRDLRKGQLYYYRLKQIDFNGQFQYSKMVSAKIERNQIAIIFSPNPVVNGQTSLTYHALTQGELTLRIFDLRGKELLLQNYEVIEGRNQFEVDFSALGAGVFFVKLEQGANSTYKKVILH